MGEMQPGSMVGGTTRQRAKGLTNDRRAETL